VEWRATPCLGQFQRRRWEHGRSQWAAGTDLPILAVRTQSLVDRHMAAYHVGVGKANSCEAEGMLGSTERLRDSRFAPCCSERWQGTCLAAGLRRRDAGCIQERNQSGQSAAIRSSTRGWPKKRSWRTCNPDRRAGTAQQTIDLQMRPQRGVRYGTRMVSSNLTAGIRAASHPLTEDEVWDAVAMPGSRR